MDPLDANESFLPRLLAVFYATFDEVQGPVIVYQVPEGSIDGPSPAPLPLEFSCSSSSLPLSPADYFSRDSSPSTSSANISFHNQRPPSPAPTAGTSVMPSKRQPLVDFNSILEYVIPKPQISGRLVHCNTPRHRILGFPVVLRDARYTRHTLRFNLCFVFDRWADVSCYEPIVRKCARVLTECEKESSFLTSPSGSQKLYQIIEQLYEDLNSYSETSIYIDGFNSLELKIFPFYPNPPEVDDWQVPIALLNLERRRDRNWDLAITKVCPHINGVNHVRKIAELADVSPEATRLCMQHLLFYQCIMMVDIFQFSNMYTLTPSIRWLADDPSVIEECGIYVTYPGHDLPSFPRLLHLYTRLKPGKTVHMWEEENGVCALGVDVRRFISFGVIKGFLRRVERWPVLIGVERGRRGRLNESVSETGLLETPTTQYLQLRETNNSTFTSISIVQPPPQPSTSGSDATPTATHPHPHPMFQAIMTGNSNISPAQIVLGAPAPPVPPAPSNSPQNPSTLLSRPHRPINWRSFPDRGYPEGLPPLLDGCHPGDELCVKFGMSWPELERCLAKVGGVDDKEGATDGTRVDLGRVKIVYR